MNDFANFQMIDIGKKQITNRRAVATGRISMSPDAMHRVLSKTLPKGDVFALAEVAGLMAAKRTSDLLPLCHPLVLESIRIWHEVGGDTSSVSIFCEVQTHAKTGVEMEALAGVMGALLCMHDLIKMFDPATHIADVAVIKKEGGKSGVWENPRYLNKSKHDIQKCIEPGSKEFWTNVKCGVLTISDRAATKVYQDESGPAIANRLAHLGTSGCQMLIVPDNAQQIADAVNLFIKEHRCDLVFTTGGTGLGTRDLTPEALSPLFRKTFPGLGELMRSAGSFKTPFAWLSRSGAGVIDHSLVVMLPGSPKAVCESLESIEPLLPHALKMIRDEKVNVNGGRHVNVR